MVVPLEAIQAPCQMPALDPTRPPAQRAWVDSVSGRLYRGVANERDDSDEAQRTEPDQVKVVLVQKRQTIAMSVSTWALAASVTSSVSNEAIDDMTPELVMMQSPSSKMRHAEL
jgi:hypothetical protein